MTLHDVVDPVAKVCELGVPCDRELGGGAAERVSETIEVSCVPTYEFSDGNVVAFRRANHVRGCAYRVSINGMGVDYLYDGAEPSAATARFVYEKHVFRDGL